MHGKSTLVHSFALPFALLAAFVGTLMPLAAHADAGHDFIAEARLFYRAVACGSEEPVPAPLDAKVVAAHCRAQAPRVARFRKAYVSKAMTFLAAIRPAALPDKVIYPFGGGDLVSALVTYPDAAEITTISLEHPGDPRRLGSLSKRKLDDSLKLFRETVSGLLRNNDSASDNLKKMERGPIPGQLAFFLLALAIHDYEPISLKFFRLEDGGSIHYLTLAEIEAADGKLAERKGHSWVDTDYSVAFTNMELAFRRRGDAGAPIRVHRHLAANLHDDHFRDSPLARHLGQKGKIAAMTKAASYLLWNSKFSAIRTYLLQNMMFMISDSTGVPPVIARRAGFAQTTYGTYTGAYLRASEKHDQAFIGLWESQRKRRLPFRYGYPDAAGNYHLLITAPKQSR